ncbi:tail fiber assembly protein [Yersinia enterocolitica]|uniref:tail fiber assembly protein n=2 Tax=Yersinia enterocolitica TaxID=630 RepID=UPI0003D90BED|nr:tail fiber assembly protein [Yersinia enterocolitica]EKN6210310.1 phage tail protein [Yersinia enterocolitica]ELY5239895.1 tail fiber assembly protein [Yersinia enterocolitica]CCQ38788.1 putative phage protein [Yersinia enterocolitica (type O:5) str. YE53/03]HEA3717824.1 tail fiber assembly protein [Yersinia enterocolitica]HED5570454.1 tail fiber assembly protein [Yersinia enterocolitica]
MRALFSPSLITFIPDYMVQDESYPPEISNNLVVVTDEELALYWRQTPPVGKTLGVAIGRPVWVDLPPPTHEELVANANAKKSQLKAIADSEIEWRQDAVDDRSASDKEITALASWRKYRVALMRVDTSNPLEIEWPVLLE